MTVLSSPQYRENRMWFYKNSHMLTGSEVLEGWKIINGDGNGEDIRRFDELRKSYDVDYRKKVRTELIAQNAKQKSLSCMRLEPANFINLLNPEEVFDDQKQKNETLVQEIRYLRTQNHQLEVELSATRQSYDHLKRAYLKRNR